MFHQGPLSDGWPKLYMIIVPFKLVIGGEIYSFNLKIEEGERLRGLNCPPSRENVEAHIKVHSDKVTCLYDLVWLNGRKAMVEEGENTTDKTIR